MFFITFVCARRHGIYHKMEDFRGEGDSAFVMRVRAILMKKKNDIDVQNVKRENKSEGIC